MLVSFLERLELLGVSFWLTSPPESYPKAPYFRKVMIRSERKCKLEPRADLKNIFNVVNLFP